MPRTVTTAFISSTSVDLVAHRQAVIAALLRRGIHPIGMEHFNAATAPPLEVCLKKLSTADIYIGILGHWFGSSPPGKLKSYTQLEYDAALRQGIEILVFFVSDEYQLDAKYQSTGDDARRLEKFKTTVERQHTRQCFTNPDNLAQLVLASIPAHFLADADRNPTDCDISLILSKFGSASIPLLNWPKTLANGHWIDRPELTSIESRLQADSSVTLLLGSPGSGKSALLSRICQSASERGFAVLGIKADAIPNTINTSEEISGHFQLPASIEKCLTVIASQQPVLVAIDQLDALADLSDLRSGRLNALLQLVSAIHHLPNVHILASCREFEFHHDVRLQSFEQDALVLKLPEWNLVAQQLSFANISGSESWNEKFRELLRTPQYLDVYLRRFEETGSIDLFRSYQQLLDDMWCRKVDSEEKETLLHTITERLREEESLWVPRADFRDLQSTIDRLIADGILVVQQTRVGFSHQTLLEHAKARFFLRDNTSLAEYVSARQNGLFVRPTIWTTLTYLREVSRRRYVAALESLFQEELRLHIRYLLIDFLGQVRDPEPVEVELLCQSLDVPDDRVRVAVAIRGSETWFQHLSSTFIPQMMQWPSEELGAVANLLIHALQFAGSECLTLIRRFWLNRPTEDRITAAVLRELPTWDSVSLDVACRVGQRVSAFDRWWAEDLAYVISESAPNLAPLYVRDLLWNEYRREPSRGRNQIEDNQSWHDLPALADAAPVEFLREVWPWFVAVVKRDFAGTSSSVINEYDGSALQLNRKEEFGLANFPRLDAIESAVRAVASQFPKVFLEITQSSWEIELLPIHQLLCRGLADGANHFPAVVVEYLSGDARRLNVMSSYQYRNRESCRVVAAVSRHLSPSQLSDLVRLIRAWSPYRSPAEIGPEQTVWERELRLHLLSSIPEDLFDAESRAFVSQETEQLPNWNRKLVSHKGGFVATPSPMSQEEIRGCDAETVALALENSLEENTVETDWTADGPVRRGTRDGLVRELTVLAKEEPERAISLLPSILRRKLEKPIARILHELGNATISAANAFYVIRMVVSSGLQGEELRSAAAYVLYRNTTTTSRLPEDLCKYLEDSLRQTWTIMDDVDWSPRPERPHSTLGDSGDRLVFSTCADQVLRALTVGLLTRDPPDLERWYDSVEFLTERIPSKEFWCNVFNELQWICLEKNRYGRGGKIISKLFENNPRVFATTAGGHFLASVYDWLPESLVSKILVYIRGCGWPLGEQCYGELLTVIALQEQDKAQFTETLSDVLTEGVGSGDIQYEEILTGVAYSAARMWDEPECRARAADLLVRLIEVATPRIAEAIRIVFWSSEDFGADQNTEKLLSAILAHPQCVVDDAVNDLAAHLARLAIVRRDLVLKVCRSLVNKRSVSASDRGRGCHMAGAHLVNITMTLQRFEDTRSDAIELFEKLLKFGVSDAYSSLLDIDLRPGVAPMTAPRPRRRRRK